MRCLISLGCALSWEEPSLPCCPILIPLLGQHLDTQHKHPGLVTAALGKAGTPQSTFFPVKPTRRSLS